MSETKIINYKVREDVCLDKQINNISNYIFKICVLPNLSYGMPVYVRGNQPYLAYARDVYWKENTLQLAFFNKPDRIYDENIKAMYEIRFQGFDISYEVLCRVSSLINENDILYFLTDFY